MFNSFDEVSQYAKGQSIALSFGNFDGLHLGHKFMIQEFVDNLKDDTIGVLVTFSPHPFIYFNQSQRYLINTERTKLSKLKRFDKLKVLRLKFDDFQKMSMEDFWDYVYNKISNITYIKLGHDFKMGADKKNPINYIESKFKDIRIDKTTPYKVDANIVSSTLIREKLMLGDIKTTNNLLGHEFSIEGKIIKGKQLGRTIGFPTINLEIDKNQLVPKRGVYQVKVLLDDQTFNGMLNVGVNPTVSKTLDTKLEVHVLNFNSDVYGKEVKVSLVKFIREEIEFKEIEDLKNQIEKDIKAINV